MALSQFSCPHCRSPFQVDTSLASLQVACPHCREPVAVISAPPVVEPPTAAPPMVEPPVAEPSSVELPTPDRPGYSPSSPLPQGAVVLPETAAPQQVEELETIVEDFRSRQITADDRASRKFVKNMIVWVCCAIVLVSILAIFLMQGGS